jgi:glycerate 2-kinase
MRILIAFDKFKDSLGAPQACDVAARTLRATHPDWSLDACPLADGGDGFADILTRAVGGRRTVFQVTGPRGGLLDAAAGLVEYRRIPAQARTLLGIGPGAEGTAAVLEMAGASGLALLPPELRDPWQATSYGTGQLVRAAAESGADLVLLGVGGSATQDLGLGALAALGVEFIDGEGRRVRLPVPSAWPGIKSLGGGVFPSIPPIRIACDVTNPLLGPMGTAAVFGPQKGLSAADIGRLDEAGARMAALMCEHFGKPASLADQVGAGAAGGIAFGLMAAAGARLLPGFGLVSAWLGIEERIAAADIVVTGEGRFDESSLGGKGPGAIAARARDLGKRVVVLAGQARGAPEGLEVRAITPEGVPLEVALRETGPNLAAAVRAAFPA